MSAWTELSVVVRHFAHEGVPPVVLGLSAAIAFRGERALLAVERDDGTVQTLDLAPEAARVLRTLHGLFVPVEPPLPAGRPRLWAVK